MSVAKVSIIVPTHNRSDLLLRTLLNVGWQTFKDVQVCVVDDCSSDETQSVVSAWVTQSANFLSHRFESPKGACAARNVGIAMTDSDYVCFLDSDDLMHPEKLERQVAELNASPEVDAVVCQMAHFAHDPNQAELLWNTFQGESPRKRFLAHEPVWGIHAPLWRRAALVRTGGFDESLPMAQDYELHVRALVKGVRFSLRNELLTYCRRHQGPAISTARTLPRLQTLDRVFRSLEPHVEKAELSILATNFVWLAKQAAGWRDVGLVKRSCAHANELGARLPFQFQLLCLLTAWSGRHRFMRMATQRAESDGHPLGQREDWYHRHRISDEVGIEVPKMPAGSF